jgi:SNF2 family DNA or RNA helicase
MSTRRLTKLFVNGGRLVIIPERGLDYLCAQLPDRVKLSKLGGYSVAATPFMAERVVSLFFPYGADPEQSFLDLWAEYVTILSANEQREQFGETFESSTAAWPHQIKAFNFLKRINQGALFAAMGCGKSKIVVDLIQNLSLERVLIIAPKRAIEVWPKQFKIHGLSRRGLAIVPLRDPMTMTERADWLEMTPRVRGKCTVFVTNYAALVPGSEKRPNHFAERLRKEDFDLVVMDESHHIKAPGGRTSKFAAVLSGRAKRRLCLTGTPMPNSPIDIYGQYRFLDPGVFGSFREFQERFVVYGGFQMREVLGFKDEEELARRYGQIAFEVSKDVLDLPPVVENEVPVRLDRTSMRAHAELDNEMALEFGRGETVTVSNILTKIIRQQQITSGYLPVVVTSDEDGAEPVEKIQQMNSAKFEALREILGSVRAEEPVVVFYKFNYDLMQIKAAAEDLEAPRRVMVISGGRDDHQEWQRAEGGEVLAVQIKAGGEGIDLTRAAYTVYYSLTYSLGDMQQSKDRTHRPGQTRTTNYYYLVADGTVDESIMTCVRTKKSIVDFVREKMSEQYRSQSVSAGRSA